MIVIETVYFVQVSRKISYKALIKDCLFFISRLCHVHAGLDHDPSCEESCSSKQHEKCSTAVMVGFLEVKNCTCISVLKLLVLVRFVSDALFCGSLLGSAYYQFFLSRLWSCMCQRRRQICKVKLPELMVRGIFCLLWYVILLYIVQSLKILQFLECDAELHRLR